MIGPNGAGTTTLLLRLNGILGQAAGSTGVGQVLVGGVEVSKAPLGEVRRRLGLVIQDPDDQLFMPTVRDDIAFGPTNLGLSMLAPSRTTRQSPSSSASGSVVLDSGRVAHDGGTLAVLQDPELLARHRLELPVGFDPAAVVPRGRTGAGTSLP